ncbi:NADP-dependent oxidoreductase domain-containing protein [Suillus tomentosus]|nr:NADP-dependent oxidoreductase domain-containing protein [Suillus tomentosus]
MSDLDEAIELYRAALVLRPPAFETDSYQVAKSTCADTVYNAIKAGYRLLDGVGDYGNEKEAGEGVRRAIADGLEDLCDNVKQITKMQLKLWGIDYFDLFLVDFPIALKYVDPSHRYPPELFGDGGKVYTRAMEEPADEKLAKNIGLSNCQGSLILDVPRYAKYEPQVLQPSSKLCKAFNITVIAYSSFGPQTYVKLAEAQALLRWATQRGIAVILKSNDLGRLSANLDCNSFDLFESELAALSALNINLRLNDPADIDGSLGHLRIGA